MESENGRNRVRSACSKDLYARVIRRRAFTRWINFYLKVADIRVDDVCALKRSGITGKLLETLTGREISVSYKENKTRKQEWREWERILSFLESENPDFDVAGKCMQLYF